MGHEIEVKRVMEHYEIYVNGKFNVSCDVNELTETLKEVEEEIRRDGE